MQNCRSARHVPIRRWQRETLPRERRNRRPEPEHGELRVRRTHVRPEGLERRWQVRERTRSVAATPACRWHVTTGSCGEVVIAGPLLQTKLHVPRPRRGLVARPGRAQAAEPGADSALTLVSAPATSAKLVGASSIPTSDLTFNAKLTSRGARNTRPVLMYANVYSEMNAHRPGVPLVLRIHYSLGVEPWVQRRRDRRGR